MGEAEGDGVMEPEAPGESVPVSVEAPEDVPDVVPVLEGVALGVAVGEGVTPPALGDAEAVLLPLDVALGVALDVRERVAVPEGDAPALSVPVGVA